MNERYIVVLLTDDGTGKMVGYTVNETHSLECATTVCRHIYEVDTLTLSLLGIHGDIQAMNPMDMSFFGDSNRCAYVHRTQ